MGRHSKPDPEDSVDEPSDEELGHLDGGYPDAAEYPGSARPPGADYRYDAGEEVFLADEGDYADEDEDEDLPTEDTAPGGAVIAATGGAEGSASALSSPSSPSSWWWAP